MGLRPEAGGPCEKGGPGWRGILRPEVPDPDAGPGELGLRDAALLGLKSGGGLALGGAGGFRLRPRGGKAGP